MNTIVNCPRCKKEVIWVVSSKYRPFCSERCRLQDLGAWFMEEHTIEGDENSSLENFSHLEKSTDNFN